ncbi:hydrophobic domain protein [Atopobium sp. oral taxon 810 str. F0209]|nr:hydrophobic domain protein [Atopobium sp. oral taxon 810 str. F0209]
MLIASVGLNMDSTEAVVGAMLICPLMGSVMGFAYAVATADSRMLRELLFGFVVQVIICLITSTLYFVISPISNETSELLTNSNPNIWDVLIALAGGFAGGLGISRNQEPSTLLSGVAVATALMPPLCAAGYGIAMAKFTLFAGAFYEFLLNVVFIAVSAQLVMMLLKVPLKRDLNGDEAVNTAENEAAMHRSMVLRRRVAIGTVIFLIPCVLLTVHAVNETMAQNSGEAFIVQDSYEVKQTTLELEAICPGFVSYRVGAVNAYDSKSGALSQRLVATLKTTDELDSFKKSEIRGLVHVHIKQLDELRFEVEAKDGEAATVTDAPSETDAAKEADVAKPNDAASAPSSTTGGSATK